MRNKYNKDYIPLEINLSLYLGKLSNVSSSHLKPVQNVLSIRGALYSSWSDIILWTMTPLRNKGKLLLEINDA